MNQSAKILVWGLNLNTISNQTKVFQRGILGDWGAWSGKNKEIHNKIEGN